MADPTPSIQDLSTTLFVDPAGRGAFTYLLHSRRRGAVHVSKSSTEIISAIFCSTG